MSKVQDLQVVYRDPAELIPYARNARTHSDDQVQRIAASIKEFGFTQPILLDGQNGILAGHGRLAAAQLLKLDRVPTIDLKGLTQAQQRAYILADNRLALDAGWDEEMLAVEIGDLNDAEFDLSVTGFTEEEIEQALTSGDDGEASREGEDEIPEADPLVAPKTKRGDVWILGVHRLMCGDATNADDVKALAGGGGNQPLPHRSTVQRRVPGQDERRSDDRKRQPER